MIVAGIDAPGLGDQLGSVLRLIGWAFARPHPVARVEVRLDGRFVALLLPRMPRTDVQALHDAAPPHTGFAATLDLTDVAAGPHELRVSVYDMADECTTLERTFVRTERWSARDREPGAPTILALYLPQFHPSAVNDASWGAGFTEWTNVVPAQPLFKHHYQPHLPAELGFYDLRVPETREAQARLAAEHGIGGFVYYHYWFSGRKVLDRPLREVVASNAPRFPFCVCFANENWTRRWDGRDSDVLLAQHHSPEDDLAFIRDLIPVFRDDRYIRIDGRPLLLVYRPSLFPDPARTAELWRSECVAAGVGDPYLAYLQSFAADDPAAYGFDAAVEFPPLNYPVVSAVPWIEELAPGFSGGICDYEALRAEAARRPDPPYTLFRGVMPSWDNTPRRGTDSWSFTGASPESYRAWLDDACRWTMRQHPPSQRLVFVNAWNEWGEGCHLEPDQRYGRLYLEATRDVAARYASVNTIARAQPLASVIVPCYNHERYVANALASALDQTVDSLEVIAIDDGSSDGTVAAMKRLKDERGDDRLRIFAQTNRGAHEAINLGLSRVRGEYVAILNSDDAYAPERLEAMIAALERDGTDFAFSRVTYVDDGGDDVTHVPGRPLHYLRKQLERAAYPELVYALLDFNLTISTGNFVFRKSLYDRLGGFKPLLWCHDWDFVLRAMRKAGVTYVDRGLYYYRFHGQNSWASYEHLGKFEGGFVMEEFFSDHAFVRALYERDPAYFRDFVEEHDYAQYGALEAIGDDSATESRTA